MGYNSWTEGKQENIDSNGVNGLNTHEWYDRNLLENAREEFIISNFTAKKTMPKFEGDTAIFSYYEHLPTFTTPLVENSSGNSLDLSKVNIRAKMNVFGAFVDYTDDLDIYGEDGARFKQDVTTNLGGAAGQSQETIIFATAGANATSIVFDTDLDNTLKVAELALRNALAKKFTSMITGSTKYSTTPVRPGFAGFVTPEGALKLEDELAGFIPVEKYGYSDGLLPNEVGSYRGVRYCETTLWTDTSNDTLQALIIGEEAIAETGIRGMKKIETVIKDLGENGDDKLNRSGSIGSKFRLAVATLRVDHVMLVELETNAP